MQKTLSLSLSTAYRKKQNQHLEGLKQGLGDTSVAKEPSVQTGGPDFQHPGNQDSHGLYHPRVDEDEADPWSLLTSSLAIWQILGSVRDPVSKDKVEDYQRDT